MPSALCENETLSGIGASEAQKLRVFCNSRVTRTTICRDQRGRCPKAEGFLQVLRDARGPPRGSAVDVQKSEGSFCKFPISNCPHNPLRGLAWSRRFLPCRIALAMVPCESSRIFAVRARHCAEIVRVRSLSLWSRVNLRISSRSARDRLRGSSQLLSATVVRKVRPRSSGCKVATFKYKSSTRSTSPQLRLQSRNL